MCAWPQGRAGCGGCSAGPGQYGIIRDIMGGGVPVLCIIRIILYYVLVFNMDYSILPWGQHSAGHRSHLSREHYAPKESYHVKGMHFNILYHLRSRYRPKMEPSSARRACGISHGRHTAHAPCGLENDTQGAHRDTTRPTHARIKLLPGEG